jgi:hypothetical protein
MNVTVAVTSVLLGFIALLGAALIWFIYSGKIDLTRIISEPTGDASMSRLQLLIFTFVIALSFFLIIASAKEPGFPDIPGGVLTLLGISASSYLVSKGIQFSQPEGVEDRPPQVVVTPASATLKPGETVTFKADVRRIQNKDVDWSIIPPGIGEINSDTGVYSAPKAVPKGVASVTIQALSVADASGVGTATVYFVNLGEAGWEHA